MERKHIAYIDPLRLLACLSVVFMHTAADGLNFEAAQRPGWYALAAVSSLAFCAVPLFFMISGYLLTDSPKTGDVSVLLKRRLPRLVLPLAFWSAAHIALTVIRSRDWSVSAIARSVPDALQSPVNISFWFMYTLIAVYLVSPVLCAGLRTLDRRGAIFIGSLIALLLLRSVVKILFPQFAARYLSFDVLDSLELFGSNLCAFVLGWFLGRTKRRVPQLLLCGLLLLLWGGITAGTVVLSKRTGEYQAAFQSQTAGFEVALAACVFLLVKQSRLSRFSKLQRAAQTLAPLTFPVYLCHALLLRLLFAFWTPLSFLSVIAAAAAVFAVSMLLAWCLSLIPVLSFLSCGIIRKKREAQDA